jgi:hypothetical protein
MVYCKIALVQFADMRHWSSHTVEVDFSAEQHTGELA